MAKTAKKTTKPASKKKLSGYGDGGVDTVISVEDVTRQVAAIAEDVTVEKLDALVDGESYVTIENLRAGYGKMEILHDINLRVGRKQSLCLIGPNGAGKSTILHAIFGFNNIFSGNIRIGDGARLGLNSTVIEHLTLGEYCYVAAGAAVIRDVAPGDLVAGVPAVVKKQRV